MAYIYEHIRTRGFEPLHFEEHFARLDALARKLLLSPIAIEREELKRRITECLRREGYSANTMNAVCVKYHSDKSVEISAEEMLYRNFDLRTLRPQGHILRLSGEIILDNTSAKEAMLDLNRSMIESNNNTVPIWVDELGEVLSIDGASAVAVFDNEIRFSRWANSVEADMAQQFTLSHNRRVSRGAIMVEDLETASEVFFIDYRGVTALKRHKNHHYADIIAEKCAKQVALSEQ